MLSCAAAMRSARPHVDDALCRKTLRVPADQPAGRGTWPRPSIQKNFLMNLSKTAICSTDKHLGLKLMITLVSLGQKDPDPVQISSLLRDHADRVLALSVHVACSVQACQHGIDLM
ncbi:hypothetical protein WMY93_022815 [Mugilogobius chulae]|uniref:Uncharacterized protein n=1 Tax=Mugilogobius chulae TaxID=88201 RepID=A0AAW0N9K2_9GOBI